jgi:hypothetical protein
MTVHVRAVQCHVCSSYIRVDNVWVHRTNHLGRSLSRGRGHAARLGRALSRSSYSSRLVPPRSLDAIPTDLNRTLAPTRYTNQCGVTDCTQLRLNGNSSMRHWTEQIIYINGPARLLTGAGPTGKILSETKEPDRASAGEKHPSGAVPSLAFALDCAGPGNYFFPSFSLSNFSFIYFFEKITYLKTL